MTDIDYNKLQRAIADAIFSSMMWFGICILCFLFMWGRCGGAS